ncbi:MAG: Fic family protein [Paludibacteraceae bacterium]|nr:Fic family protein [Paludibacteraceae bacterium]
MINTEVLFKEWQALQPLKDSDRTRLEQKFMLEFNYNSNHIEGNTLTYGQTELLLLFDKTDGSAPMRDYEQMKAHQVALKMVQQAALEKEQRPLTETFIRQLHQTMLREDYTVYKEINGQPVQYTVHAGIYKTRPNSVITVTGEKFEYASPEETSALMTDLVSWYNAAEEDGRMSPLELAALFHYRYIRIHPFEDGNGRISRLLVNFILARHGYPMIVVRSKDKDQYLTALNKCDTAVGLVPADGAHAELKQIRPFVDYLAACLERALLISIRAAKGEDISESDDWRKKLKVKYQNKLNKPELTDDIEAYILDRVVPAMLDKIHSELAEFYSIFKSVRWFPNVAQYEIAKDNSHLESSIVFVQERKKMDWYMRINIFVTLQQFESKYIINAIQNGSPSAMLYQKNLSYSDALSEQDIMGMVNAIGRCLNEFLEQA